MKALMPTSFHFSFGDEFKQMTGAVLEGVKRRGRRDGFEEPLKNWLSFTKENAF